MARRLRRRWPAHGPARARFMLDELAASAREPARSAGRRRAARLTSTRIPAGAQPAFPGDLAIEERLASLMRWNALAMVVRANQAYGELGGHIASYASAADLFEVGFNHFFRARDDAHRRRPGVLPAAQRARRLRARLPRRPAERDDLAHYRQEIGAGADGARGLSQLPAPVADAGLLAVPDRLDGHRPDQLDLPRALHALPQHRGLLDTAQAQASGACSATARWTSPRA